MKLFGRKILEPLRGKDAAVDAWLRAWTAELIHGTWKSELEVMRQYPRTYSNEQGTFVVPVGGEKVVIEVMFNFSIGIVIINRLRNE